MKIHITNQYPYRDVERVGRMQHTYCKVGREFGFQEMGIYTYPVETDSDSEMRKRIDGILASLESNDIVVLQLPTGNGLDFENKLVNVIKAYINTRIVLLIHDTTYLREPENNEFQSKSKELMRKANVIILPDICEKRDFEEMGIKSLLFASDVNLVEEIKKHNKGLMSDKENEFFLHGKDFWYKKVLIDAIIKCYDVENSRGLAENQMEEKEIHIGFGLHDKTGDYTAWVGVAIQSLIDHTFSKICFHVVHDETLSDINRERLAQLSVNGGHRIYFHLLDANAFDGVKEQMRFYTIGAMFRVMLPEILPELSRIIYLDADVLVNRDIKELWEIDISKYAMAAVPDIDVANGGIRPIPVKKEKVKREQYFNSGVLYLNMDRIRELGNMREMVFAYLQDERNSDLPDQDALNVLYGHETLLVDGVWNCFARNVRSKGEKKIQPKIYHYVGTWCYLYSGLEMDELYYTTIMRTPWGATVGKGILQKSLIRAKDRADWLEKVITAISKSGKRIVFYGNETGAMNNLYKMLTIKEGDYRVLAEKDNNPFAQLPCKDLQALKDEKDCIVFVLPEADNGTAIANLDNMGLVRNVDYFDIHYLLFPLQGGYV